MTAIDLVRVSWVDAHNNQGAWMTADELADFAKDEAYRVTQVGYKVYEDALCIVLAARLSTPSPDYGQSFGMCERIPKQLIDSETILESGGDGGDGGDSAFGTILAVPGGPGGNKVCRT